MIIQALCEYYDRKAAQGMLPVEGFERRTIPYLIVIRESGEFVKLESTAEGVGKDKTIKAYNVPQNRHVTGSTAWKVSNYLWDHYGYVFGLPKKMNVEDKKAVETGKKQCGSFVTTVDSLCQLNPSHVGLRAVKLFYQQFDRNMELVIKDALFADSVHKDGTNFAFTLLGNNEPIACDQTINYGSDKENSFSGLCLVSGMHKPIVVINNSITMPYANATGAKLVGFQKNSGYDSYHKEQGLNAPISEEVNFKYTTALNSLLKPDSRNRLMVAKNSLVFWASKDHPMEENFSFFFAKPDKDDPDRNVDAITRLLKSPLSGSLYDDSDTQFYVLLLSPNVARISVRIWEETNVQSMAVNLRQYFADLDILRATDDAKQYSLFSILASIALGYKMENLPPALFENLLRAALENLPFPQMAEMLCLNRIKADRSISSKRAGLLKAYLNRKNRYYKLNNKDITMALDKENKNEAYLCGRLFAVLEKIQEAANGKGTIRDQFYGAASRTPSVVFPRLMDLSNHHLSKMKEDGKRIFFERIKGEILNSIPAEGLPAHLSLDDQSRFAIGYYHQRQSFYEGKKENNE